MYEDNGCFDVNSMAEGTEGGLSQVLSNYNQLPPNTNSHHSYEESLKISVEGLSYHSPQDDTSATGVQIQPQLDSNPDLVQTDQHLIQQMMDPNHQILSYAQSNWESSAQDFIDPHPMDQLQNGFQGFNVVPSSLPELPDHPTPDLLSLLRLPRSSLLPNSSISFTNPNMKTTLEYNGDISGPDISAASSMIYDPLLHLNLPPQPPLIRELCQSLPVGYSMPGPRGTGCLIGVDDGREVSGGMFPDGNGAQFDNGILEFTRDMGCIKKGRGSSKGKKPYTTERDRRTHLNDKYFALKNLVPNPTKADRASVVGDAIAYIKELLRTVDELKLLVDKKRRGRDRTKRQKTEGEDGGDMEGKPLSDIDHSSDNSLRSSWLQRKSKVTEVDVRIIDDEVTIKLVQKKKINCLLFVSKVLDQLKLDLHHVAGGQIGEHYSFLFNSKIHEGSSVYASAIANTLIEVVDEQYMAALPTKSY